MPTEEAFPALYGSAFTSALAEVRDDARLRLENVRLSAGQFDELLAAAPRDGHDPSVRRLHSVQLLRTEITGDLDVDDLVCDSLQIAGATFADRLRLRVTVRDDTSVSGTTFARTDWGGQFDGGVVFESTTFGSSRFEYATFATTVSFERVHFTGVSLLRATFEGPVYLTESTFDRTVVLNDAVFEDSFDVYQTTFGAASFSQATFIGAVSVARSSFRDECLFGSATFGGEAVLTDNGFRRAVFDDATFHADACWDRSTFGGRASFEQTTFLAQASFEEASFERETAFKGAVLVDEATFAGATFEQTRQLGPLLAGAVDFHAAVFAQPVRIELSARSLSLERTLFQRGGDLLVRWAEVTLDEASFSGPSLLAAHPGVPATERLPGLLGCEQPCGEDGWLCRLSEVSPESHPRVLSLRSAKVSELTLSGVDLRACQFAGAHGLDGMRVRRSRFAQTPSGWHARLRRLRWTRRQTIVEEHLWREAHGHGEDWRIFPTGASEPVSTARVLEPEQIATFYRALRKAREDAKDEPGAADFYYGEMEMRRQAGWMSKARLSEAWVQTPRGTRSVLGAYWLVSGYGLRALRAFIALALAIALLAIPLDVCGFRPDRAYGRALLFAAESSVSLFRAPTASLSASGEVVQLVLRIVGPLLFGLAALSLRGRVKR